jgi:hypothetical protein
MKSKFILLFAMIITFVACNDKDENILQNPKAENRDRECGYCSEVKVEVNYGPVDNGCCKAEVIVKSATGLKDCNQMIFINGDFLQNVTQEITTLNYFVCPAEPIVVRVMGFDDATQDFTMICYEEKLSCATCCENVTYEVFNCGNTSDKACCSYTYKFFNNSKCEMNLYGAEGNTILNLPANSFAYKKLDACVEDPTSLKYYIGKTPTEVCKEFSLNTDCTESCNCGLSNIFVKQSKTTIKDCCRFLITAYNRSNCIQYLFEDGGKIIATLPAGTKYSTAIVECKSRDLYLGSNPDTQTCGQCASVKLVCTK